MVVLHSPSHCVAAVQGDLLNHREGQVCLVAGALWGVAAGQAVLDLLHTEKAARGKWWSGWQECSQGEGQE